MTAGSMGLLEESKLVGVTAELSRTANSELSINRGPMIGHGGRTDVEPTSNFFNSQTLAGPADDRKLAGSERPNVSRRRRRIGIVRHPSRRNLAELLFHLQRLRQPGFRHVTWLFVPGIRVTVNASETPARGESTQTVAANGAQADGHDPKKLGFPRPSHFSVRHRKGDSSYGVHGALLVLSLVVWCVVRVSIGCRAFTRVAFLAFVAVNFGGAESPPSPKPAANNTPYLASRTRAGGCCLRGI